MGGGAGRRLSYAISPTGEKVLKPAPKLELNAKNFFYTLSVCLNFMSYGMGNTLVGTSLVDLGYIFGVGEEEMSRAPLLLGIGYCAGAFFSGQITRWYTNRQIIMTACLLPMALVNFGILHTTYGVMLVLLFFYGAGFGACDTMLSVWIVELWPYHNHVILPLSLILFGVGQVVAPVMVSPYVHGDIGENDTQVTPQERINSLMIPYTICGVFQSIIPVLYIIFNFTSFKYEPLEDKNNNKVDLDDELGTKKLDPRIANNPHRGYHLVIAGVAVAAYGGAEQGWIAFAPTMYQHINGGFISASEASILYAYFSVMLAVGVLVTTFIAIKLTPDTIIFYQLALIFAGVVMMYFGYQSKPIIYIATIILGYGMAPLFAMKYAFVERHLMLTDRITSTYTVMFGVATIVVPLVLEQTSKQNPRMLLIIMAAFMTLCTLAFAVVKIWIEIIRKRYKTPKILCDI